MHDNITYWGILFIAILVIPELVLNRTLGIKSNRQTIIAVVRSVIQLSIVGLYLQFIFDLNNKLLNVAYILIMMSVAGISAVRSSNLKLRELFIPVFFSILVTNFPMVLYFNTIVLRLSDIWDAQYLITIGGMLLGNVLKGNIVGLTAYYTGIKNNHERFCYDLAMGASVFGATKPYLRDAINLAIQPTISTMETIGLVSLPGMMTGQILGGSVPMEAILYQIAIMIAIYVVRYLNVILSILFTQQVMFDDRDMLRLENFR